MARLITKLGAGAAILLVGGAGTAFATANTEGTKVETPTYKVGDTVSVEEILNNGTILNFHVKFAKRVCTSYAVVPSNINQATNAESILPVKGADPYDGAAADEVAPADEDDPGAAWASACSPKAGWEFKIGAGAVAGSVGSPSSIQTPEAQVWIDNGDGTATLSTSIVTKSSVYGIPGATAVYLTPAQYASGKAGTLLASEVTQVGTGFATLRCGNDRGDGTNVKHINIPADDQSDELVVLGHVNQGGDTTEGTTTTTKDSGHTSKASRLYCYAYNSTEQKIVPVDVTPPTEAAPLVLGTEVTPTTAAPVVAGTETLPRTGSNSIPMALVGALLAGLGGLLIVVNRRFATRA